MKGELIKLALATVMILTILALAIPVAVALADESATGAPANRAITWVSQMNDLAVIMGDVPGRIAVGRVSQEPGGISAASGCRLGLVAAVIILGASGCWVRRERDLPLGPTLRRTSQRSDSGWTWLSVAGGWRAISVRDKQAALPPYSDRLGSPGLRVGRA